MSAMTWKDKKRAFSFHFLCFCEVKRDTQENVRHWSKLYGPKQTFSCFRAAINTWLLWLMSQCFMFIFAVDTNWKSEKKETQLSQNLNLGLSVEEWWSLLCRRTLGRDTGAVRLMDSLKESLSLSHPQTLKRQDSLKNRHMTLLCQELNIS